MSDGLSGEVIAEMKKKKERGVEISKSLRTVWQRSCTRRTYRVSYTTCKVCRAEQSTLKVSIGEVGIGEVGKGEVRIFEVSAGEVSAGEVRKGECSIDESSTGEVSIGEVTADKGSTDEVNRMQVGTREVCLVEHSAVEGS